MPDVVFSKPLPNGCNMLVQHCCTQYVAFVWPTLFSMLHPFGLGFTCWSFVNRTSWSAFGEYHNNRCSWERGIPPYDTEGSSRLLYYSPDRSLPSNPSRWSGFVWAPRSVRWSRCSDSGLRSSGTRRIALGNKILLLQERPNSTPTPPHMSQRSMAPDFKFQNSQTNFDE